ncbi:MAG TPA: AI-2E family transporter [Gemmatimonadaceae bacterium]|jgi:predicted PurR-regulated permease PerM|nr:AI-2E family transporter [Gemmatimonadaceae bacterium]
MSVSPRAPGVREAVKAAEAPLTRSVALIVIAIILVFGALHAARALFIPLTCAALLSLALSPPIRFLARWHVPPPAGAFLILGVSAACLAFALSRVAPAAQVWLSQAPARAQVAARRLEAITKPVDQVTRVVDQITSARNAPTKGAVVVQPSRASTALYGTTGAIALGIGETLILLYALLAVGDLFLQKIIEIVPRLADRQKAITIAREMESSISGYLFVLAAINVTEGAAVAAGLALVGMSSPVLWGALVVLAEFVPYIGMLSIVALLTVAGLSTFDSTTHALFVPGVYVAINVIQANVATPLLMSRRLTLNPVVIFVSLALWGFIWGVPGVLLAVPILATFRILCDHVDSLAGIGAFLGEREEKERRRVLRFNV